MAKKNYFFSHQADATLTHEMAYLLKAYGYVGYGLYWRICESLFMAPGNILELSTKTYSALSLRKTSEEKVRLFIVDCIEKFELFQSNDQYFSCDWVTEQSDKVANLIKVKTDAAHKRWDKTKESMHVHNISNPDKIRLDQTRQD
jgi:hypothetical protein